MEWERIVSEDRDRALALLAVAAGHPVGAEALATIERAAEDWRRGDPALADIRLSLANLPRLDHDDAAAESPSAAACSGVAPCALVDTLGAYVPTFRGAGVTKGTVNPPRVPRGNCRGSGRWTALGDAVRN